MKTTENIKSLPTENLMSITNGKAKTDLKFAFIDNKPYEIKDGETILTFVRRNFGNELVPTLCDAPNLEPFGSCRVCSVDVALQENGSVKSQASCHTPVMSGSYIYPSSDRIQALRKNNLCISKDQKSYKDD